MWGEFRNESLNIGNLRFLVPKTIPFYVASATLPAPVLDDITDILRLRRNRIDYVKLSCDRPGIHLVVRPIKYRINTYHDLAFLLPGEDYVHGVTAPLEPFLVFFDNTKATEHTVHALHKLMPSELQDKITWFHAGMSPAYREAEAERLKTGKRWGLFTTALFGLVSVDK